MEISIFIDESGDFYECSKYYLMTLVMHEQCESIRSQLDDLERAVQLKGFPKNAVHTSPLVHKAGEYYHWTYEDRRYLFNKMFSFIRHCPITYRTFAVEKRQWNDYYQLTGRLARDLHSFLLEHIAYFQSFDTIVVYYDDGQAEITRIINIVFNTLFSSVDIRHVYPVDYRLFQAADFLCTMELLELKRLNRDLSSNDLRFFKGTKEFTKTYFKKMREKRFAD